MKHFYINYTSYIAFDHINTSVFVPNQQFCKNSPSEAFIKNKICQMYDQNL